MEHFVLTRIRKKFWKAHDIKKIWMRKINWRTLQNNTIEESNEMVTRDKGDLEKTFLEMKIEKAPG